MRTCSSPVRTKTLATTLPDRLAARSGWTQASPELPRSGLPGLIAPCPRQHAPHAGLTETKLATSRVRCRFAKQAPPDLRFGKLVAPACLRQRPGRLRLACGQSLAGAPP